MPASNLAQKITKQEDNSHLQKSEKAAEKIIIVGSPNVGKSMLFNKLTGRYVTVSNYPGTTVEIAKGKSASLGRQYEVIDTPGMYSLSPITEEEQVACSILLEENTKAVIHVIDAKNIQRMLSLTLQLIEAQLPVILALNMADEAEQLGIEIDKEKLEELLGIPVVETVATTGSGVNKLLKRTPEIGKSNKRGINYGPEVESAIQSVASHLNSQNHISVRTQALLILQAGDNIQKKEGTGNNPQVREIVDQFTSKMEHPVGYYCSLTLKREVDRIVEESVTFPSKSANTFRETLSRLCMHPVTGLPILLAVLYFGLYKFVGVFGAGTLVDFLEGSVFEEHINPWVNSVLGQIIPWVTFRELFGGEYGIITLGVRYAVAIILPVVGTFFIAFSILEDSGYLPRLAMLIDRLFKKIGLNGRAVIPIVLGFGCDTMATMVTRTLESRREKVIASFLLALAIPCSAQLGVILGLLSGHPDALLLWAGFILLIFLTAGFLAAKLLPGRGPSFYMELPPLRLPRFTNVVVKTYTRIVWYFKEIFPLFILASVVIWIGQITGIFQLAVSTMKPAVKLLGLPTEAAPAFLFGFFRRDYGVAGLFDLQSQGALNGNQLAVAAITLTLFLPCVAQFLILKKERGLKLTLITSFGILALAFGAGFLVNSVLNLLGVSL